VIVGAGIGGLVCAAACRRANRAIKVTVLERTAEILTIGAGIHVPPNGCRALQQLGVFDKLKKVGAYQVENFVLRRYSDGRILAEKPLKGRCEREFGAEWM